VVEVVVGAAPSTSVLVVVRADDPALRRELDYLSLGPGPTYLLTRPFHLCGTELAASIAAALTSGEPTIAPRAAPAAVVFAAAKRDLEPGTELERIGGTTHHGVIDTAQAALAEGLLPVGLARGARLRSRLAAGRPIALADVEVDRAGLAWRLFEEACLPWRPETRRGTVAASPPPAARARERDVPSHAAPSHAVPSDVAAAAAAAATVPPA
jgi:predicted homoserine dehydrogenase-like protein